MSDRKFYDRNFQRNAINQWKTSGKSASEVEEELGLSAGSLYRWNRALADKEKKDQAKKGTHQPSTTKSNNTLNVNSLGYFLDGWADIVENMGEKAEEVKDKVYKQLIDRHMPDIIIKHTKGVVGITGSEKRDYRLPRPLQVQQLRFTLLNME